MFFRDMHPSFVREPNRHTVCRVYGLGHAYSLTRAFQSFELDRLAKSFCMVLLSHMDTDFLIQSVSEGLTRGFEIVSRLEVHPELCLHPKEAAQSQGCICRDPSLSMDNLI